MGRHPRNSSGPLRHPLDLAGPCDTRCTGRPISAVPFPGPTSRHPDRDHPSLGGHLPRSGHLGRDQPDPGTRIATRPTSSLCRLPAYVPDTPSISASTTPRPASGIQLPASSTTRNWDTTSSYLVQLPVDQAGTRQRWWHDHSGTDMTRVQVMTYATVRTRPQ